MPVLLGLDPDSLARAEVHIANAVNRLADGENQPAAERLADNLQFAAWPGPPLALDPSRPVPGPAAPVGLVADVITDTLSGAPPAGQRPQQTLQDSHLVPPRRLKAPRVGRRARILG